MLVNPYSKLCRERPRTHDRGTRRKWNIVFLDEFLVRLVENLVELSLRTHCQNKISSFSNALTFNTYNGRGSSIPLAQPLGLLLLISCYCMLSKSLVRDDSRFSVCYSVTNVLSPLRTILLPKVGSHLILYCEHVRVSKHTHERVPHRKPAWRETRWGNWDSQTRSSLFCSSRSTTVFSTKNIHTTEELVNETSFFSTSSLSGLSRILSSFLCAHTVKTKSRRSQTRWHSTRMTAL